MSPSVRGLERVRVVGILLVTGVVTGGLVGFLPGAVWRALDLPPAGALAAVAVVVVALALDVAGRPAPLAVRRQVPQLWGRIFGPGTAALLYGARLGVGPLTILTTWQWWAAMAIAVSHGPWAGALTGGAFHAARTATMLVAVTRAGGSMAPRMAAVQRRERTVTTGGRLLVVAAAAVVLAAGSGGDDPHEVIGSPTPVEDDAGQSTGSNGSTGSTGSTRSTDSTGSTGSAGRSSTAAPVDAAASPAESTTTSTTTATPEESALMSVLLEEALPGFRRHPPLETPDLDLAGAAALERDSAAERSLLETRRFVRGTSRAWRNDAGDVILVTIYDFADAAGAAAYLADGAEHLQARGAETFDVPDLPDALGFTQVDETSDGAFTGHGVAFARGDRHVLVVAGSSSSGLTADDARRVAVAQAARLQPPH